MGSADEKKIDMLITVLNEREENKKEPGMKDTMKERKERIGLILEILKKTLKEINTFIGIMLEELLRKRGKEMTCREKMELEKPHLVDKDKYIGGCDGCPHDYGYAEEPYYCKDGYYEQDNDCWDCWDREVEEVKEEKEKRRKRK